MSSAARHSFAGRCDTCVVYIATTTHNWRQHMMRTLCFQVRSAVNRERRAPEVQALELLPLPRDGVADCAVDRLQRLQVAARVLQRRLQHVLQR